MGIYNTGVNMFEIVNKLLRVLGSGYQAQRSEAIGKKEIAAIIAIAAIILLSAVGTFLVYQNDPDLFSKFLPPV